MSKSLRTKAVDFFLKLKNLFLTGFFVLPVAEEKKSVEEVADDIEKSDRKAKKVLNEIATKIHSYIMLKDRVRDHLPLDFVYCSDIRLINEYINKGLTGRALKLLLGLASVDGLNYAANKNERLLKNEALTDEEKGQMTELITKQKDIAETINKYQSKFQIHYDRQRKEIQDKV